MSQSSVADPSTQLDRYISQQMQKTGAQVRLFDLFTACLTAVSGLFAALFLLAIIDAWVFELGTVGRWGSFIAVIGGTSYYVARHILPLLLRRINPVYSAKVVEQSQPSLKNNLINYVLLRKQRERVPRPIIEAVGHRAAHGISGIPVENTVDKSQTIHMAIVLTVLVVVFGAYKIVSPKDPFRSFARVLAPGYKMSRPSRVLISNVQPGDTNVYFGQSLEVSAQISGQVLDRQVKLVYSTDDGQIVDGEIPMERKNSTRVFAAELKTSSTGIEQGLTYRLVAGDGRTDDYRVTVKSAPTLTVDSIHYQPPAYTGLDPHESANPDIEAIEGTRITIDAEANTDIKTAYVELLQPDSDRAVSTVSMNVQPPNRAVGEFVLHLDSIRERQKYSHYQLRFITGDGQRNEPNARYSIRIIPDLAPEVQILEPVDSRISVPANSRVRFKVRASDPDFEIDKIQALVEHRGSPLRTSDLPLGTQDRGQQLEAPFDLWPKKLNLDVQDEVLVHFRAFDNRKSAISGAPDSNVTSTEKILVTVIDPIADPPQDSAGDEEQSGDGQGENQTGQDESGQDQSDQDRSGQNQSESGGQNEQQSGDSGIGQDPATSDPTGSEQSDQAGQSDSSDEKSGDEKSDDGQAADSQGESKRDNSRQSDTNQPDQSDQSSSEGQPTSDQTSQSSNQQQDESASGSNAQSRQADGQSSTGESNRDTTDSRAAQSGSQASDQSQSKTGQASDQSSASGDPSSTDASQSSTPRDSTSQPDVASEAANQQQQPGVESGEVSPLDENAHDGEIFERIMNYRNRQQRDQQTQPDSQSAQDATTDPQSSPPDSSQAEKSASDSQQPGESTENNQQQARQSDSQTDAQQNAQSSSANEKSDPSNQQSDSADQSKMADADAQQPSTGQSDNQKSDRQPSAEASGDEKSQSGDAQSGQSERQPPGQSQPSQPQQGNQDSSQSSSADSSKQSQTQNDPSQQPAQGESSQSSAPGDSSSQADQSSGQPGSESSSSGQPAGNQDQMESGQSQPSDSAAAQSKSGQSDSAQSGQQQSGQQQSGQQQSGGDSDAEGESSDRSGQPDSSGGDPGDQRMDGDATNPSPTGSQQPSSSGSGRNPQDPNQAESQASRDTDGGQPGSGASNSNPAQGETAAADADRRGPPTQADKANLEYARKATDLVLDYLSDQQVNPDPKLLDELNWTEEDLQKFLKRWQALKKQQTVNDQERERLDNTLRSLGLAQPQVDVRSSDAAADQLSGYNEDARVIKPPPDLIEKFRAFQKRRNRARDR